MDLLAARADATPTKIALHLPDSGEAMDFRTLDTRAARAARWLVGRGLQAGERIALLMENRAELIELAFAAQRAGLYYTPISNHLRPAEIAYILADAGARLLVATPETAAAAAAALADRPDLPRFIAGGDVPGFASYEAVRNSQDPVPPLPERPVGRDLLYSSGTTGRPKGVKMPLLPPEMRSNPPVHPSWHFYGFSADTVYFSPGPLYHAAPHRYVLRVVQEGGSCIIPRKFAAVAALAAIERYRVTHSQWVPTMFHRLLALPEAERHRYDLASHRVAIHAAAPCPVALKRAMIAWWGPILYEYYAGSEAFGITVIDSPTWLAHPGSVGKPLSGAVHILGEDGRELPPTEVGTISFSGGPPFEYLNAPEKTAAAYDAAGRASYGDLGWLDAEGFLYLSDRRADLIISGGVNIYPAEVEDTLIQHPLVADAAVIGLPDAEFGEQVAAIVQPHNPAAADPATAAALIAFCHEHLAGPKCPRRIFFTDALPRSEAGKLLRRLLKEQYRSAA